MRVMMHSLANEQIRRSVGGSYVRGHRRQFCRADCRYIAGLRKPRGSRGRQRCLAVTRGVQLRKVRRTASHAGGGRTRRAPTQRTESMPAGRCPHGPRAECPGIGDLLQL